MFTQKPYILISTLLSVLLGSTGASTVSKRADAFANPADGGGTMLTDTGNGLGEPLNVRLFSLCSLVVIVVSGPSERHVEPL